MDRSLNQQTYDQCKKDIMTFALKPGEPVSAAKLAERYHVSRTPAREALVRLNSEGMVDIYPQSKSIVSKINVARAKQEWFIRKTLEIEMTDAFFANVTPEDIEEMRMYARRCEELGAQPRNHETAYEYLCNDNKLHAVTYRVAGEDLSAEIINSTMAHYSRIRILVDLDNVNKDRTVADHEDLIKLIENGDIEGYRVGLKTHLERVIGDIETMSKLAPELFDMGEE
ncbi:MAG: GntR family transcriptional regulator [Eubacterium sp.]|nr:GntR family transcriptional regulator [Eubacterium sp.]